MIKPGEEWGTPTTADADLEVQGDDAELARMAARDPGAGMRARLAAGTHLPHPRIAQRTGRKIDVRWRDGSRRPIELDGRSRGRADRMTVEVVAGAYRMLV